MDRHNSKGMDRLKTSLTVHTVYKNTWQLLKLVNSNLCFLKLVVCTYELNKIIDRIDYHEPNPANNNIVQPKGGFLVRVSSRFQHKAGHPN